MIDLLPNYTFPIMLGIFLVTLFALNSLVFQPTLQIIQARRRSTSGLGRETETLLQKNKSDTLSLEQKMVQARGVAAKEREALVAKGREEERLLLATARSDNEQEMVRLQQELNQQKKEAELQLRQLAQTLARDMVEKVLDRKVA